MTRKWDLTTEQFIEEETNCSLVPTIETHPRAAVLQNQSLEAFDEQCLSSRPTTRSFITSLNEKTQQSLSTFGRSHPRLQSLSTPLWLGLRFSPITEKGFTAYNYNQNISTTATELKAFASSILEVSKQWEEAEEQFARDSSRDCRLKAVTDAPTVTPRELTSTAAPVEVVVATDNTSIGAVSLSPSIVEASSVIAVTLTPSSDAPTIEPAMSTEVTSQSVSPSDVEASSMPAVTSSAILDVSTIEPEVSAATVSVIVEALTLTPETAASEVSSIIAEVSEVVTESTATPAYPNSSQHLQKTLFD